LLARSAKAGTEEYLAKISKINAYWLILLVAAMPEY
jgi:hypothetical protein